MKKEYIKPGLYTVMCKPMKIICVSGTKTIVDETPVDNNHVHVKEQEYGSNIWDNEW